MFKLITDTLREMRQGNMVDEASRRLNEVVAAVEEHQRPGEITIKLKIIPKKGYIFVSDDITTKIPEADKASTLFYATPEGNLQRNDPNQIDLGLRSVDDDSQGNNLKDVDHG